MRLIGKLYQRFLCSLARDLAPYLAKTPVIYGDPGRVQVDPSAKVVNALFNVQSGTIEIQSNAFCGHNVSFLTGGHDVNLFGVERRDSILPGERDIIVESGAWINSSAVIIGPCRIGSNAVVLAGSVVNADVPPYTMVGGMPAKFIRKLGDLA